MSLMNSSMGRVRPDFASSHPCWMPRTVFKDSIVSAKREVGEENPFNGAVGVQRYFTGMTECALASKLRSARNRTLSDYR